MFTRFSRALSLSSALLIGVAVVTGAALNASDVQAGAQRKAPAAKALKGVSAKDQKVIEEIFKGVDPTKYRLQFNGGKRVLGKAKVSMGDLEQVRRIRNPGEAKGWIVFAVEGDDVIYLLAVSGKDLESFLGKERAARLNLVMAKYAR